MIMIIISIAIIIINIIENADATPPHLEVTLRLVSSAGMQVLCRSLHLGCSAVFCELYLYTCMDMERGHGTWTC